MDSQRINRVTGFAPVAMSIAAYFLVLAAVAARWEVNQPDEGAAAHIFQLLVAGQVPIVLVYVASADWKRPWAILRMLLIQAAAVGIAFSAVFLARL